MAKNRSGYFFGSANFAKLLYITLGELVEVSIYILAIAKQGFRVKADFNIFNNSVIFFLFIKSSVSNVAATKQKV